MKIAVRDRNLRTIKIGDHIKAWSGFPPTEYEGVVQEIHQEIDGIDELLVACDDRTKWVVADNAEIKRPRFTFHL